MIGILNDPKGENPFVSDPTEAATIKESSQEVFPARIPERVRRDRFNFNTTIHR